MTTAKSGTFTCGAALLHAGRHFHMRGVSAPLMHRYRVPSKQVGPHVSERDRHHPPTHTHTHTHAHTHTHNYTYTHTHTHTHTHTVLDPQTHTYCKKRTHMHAHMPTDHARTPSLAPTSMRGRAIPTGSHCTHNLPACDFPQRRKPLGKSSTHTCVTSL
jgi:hypothetical protein